MNYNNAVTLIAMALMIPKPSIGAEVECPYESNSEFPWLSTRVCQTQERPLVFDDEGTPFCTDARADKDGDGWGWEDGHSCVIDPTLPKRGSDVPTQEVIQEDIVVFEQDFETSNVGPYLPEVLNEQWDTPIWHLGLNEGRVQVVQDAEKGKAIEVLYPANEFGGSGATAFLNDLAFGVGFERSFEELYVSYDVKFAEGFDFVRGGKLPGLCGYNINQAPSEGCNTGGGFPTGYDGWSARGMWREEGILENYMYHADQFYEYGDDEVWDVKAQPGTWHRIQHRVVLNTVGEANGVVEAWFDGVKVLSSNNMLYRKTEDIGINLFYFSTFYGGADPSWAPSSDQYIYFDNFRIATTPLDDAEVIIAKKAPVINTAIPDATVQAPAAVTTATATATATATEIVDELVIEADSVPELVVESDVGPELAIANNSVRDEVTARAASQEPELGAANESESGGGVFLAWWLGLALIFRRKLALADKA